MTHFFVIDDPALTVNRADRALAVLLEEVPNLESISRTQIQKMIEAGQILRNGIPFETKEHLQLGDQIEVRFTPPQPLNIAAENHTIPVLFEDEHLIVVNKPPGMSVHPSPQETTGTLVNALLHQVKDLSGIGGILRPGIVHRIDKDTSGALVVCKSNQAHQAMSEIFLKHEIERAYWAFCYGAPAWTSRHLETLIGRNPKDRKKMAVLHAGTSNAGRRLTKDELAAMAKNRTKGAIGVDRRGRAIVNALPEESFGDSADDHEVVSEENEKTNAWSTGRTAITDFKRIKVFSVAAKTAFASWIEAKLETGRTHQVRVHLNELGHSVLGDPVYGTPSASQPKWKALPNAVSAAVAAMPGQALHARILGFKHPITGAMIHCVAEPFADLAKLIAELEKFGG